MCRTAVSLNRDLAIKTIHQLVAWLTDVEARLLDELDGLPHAHPARPRHADVIAARNVLTVLKGAFADTRSGLAQGRRRRAPDRGVPHEPQPHSRHRCDGS